MIQTTEELQSLCERLRRLKFITVDTEFIREKTFYSELCLIQIGGGKGAWLIDALAPDMDLTPLFDIFLDKKIIKVFHACRQDIEIFYHLMHKMPTPVFDTQIGAMVCGFPAEISYQRLVKEYLNVDLDKGMRITDWSHRPLTKEQEEYALHDVIELKSVYTKMMDEICAANRLDWIQEEIQASLDPFLYEPDAAHLLEKMPVPFQDPAKIHLLARLCEWRESWAKKLNFPRAYVLSDSTLIECAAIRLQEVGDFQKLRSISPKFLKKEMGQSLQHFCFQVAKEEVQEWPRKKHFALRPNKKNRVEALRLLLNVVAEEHNVAPTLIASTEDLVQYLSQPENVRFMKGWRYQIFGKRVQDLMNGKLAFLYDPVKKALVIRSV